MKKVVSFFVEARTAARTKAIACLTFGKPQVGKSDERAAFAGDVFRHRAIDD
jgi:hypothetical protein